MRAQCKRVLVISMAGLVSAFALTGATACRDTDVLKHINHTQSAQTVDYDTDQRYLINSEDADKTSESVPAQEVDKDAAPTEEKQNIVVYSSKPNAAQYKAKKSLFSLNPDYSGLEASDGVRLAQSKKEQAVDKDQADKATNAKDNDNGATATDGGNSDSKKRGEKASNKGEKTSKKKAQGGNKGGKTEVETNDLTGKYTETPKVNSVAAFGEYAVIVQMVGGKNALAAADKDMLSSDFKKVFADEGASNIVEGWSDDGSAKKINVKAIIKSGAQTILVDSSSYQESMNEADRKTLKKAGVTFSIMPRLSNSTYIKQAVDKVGTMLSESKDIGNAEKTENIAEQYSDFHDDVVQKCIDANDGKLAGSTVYENKNPRASKYSFNSSAHYTLLIDKYDSSAEFTGKFAGTWTPSCDGIGICTYGYADTPTSFYIQAGGLINNAADKGSSSDSGTIPAWQFSNNIMNFKKSKWKYSSTGEFAKTSDVVASAWGQVLFTTDVDQDGNGVGASFGTETFPTIITGSKSIKKAIVNNSKKANGAYHPYDRESAPGGSSFGKKIGSSICYSSIGVDGANSGNTNTFSNGQISSSSVHVNPHGLFSSWTAGSVESFLEAAWVNDDVEGNKTTVGVSSLVKEFYQTFYRYDGMSNSQVEDVLDGE